MSMESFEWDKEKDIENWTKHGVSFSEAQSVFTAPYRIIVHDTTHSITEERYFCIGKTGEAILTVRFTYRGNIIRIIGAGRWRRGKKIYEEKNQVR
ncbi:MAG: BrnT family toxin [Gammaproteobacteria bacterium]|nr:BrnT family toxin [Gammaproteobacteria bacterium]